MDVATLGLFDNLLEDDDPSMLISSIGEEDVELTPPYNDDSRMDLLTTSIQESGLFQAEEDWSHLTNAEDADALLNSILTGNDGGEMLQEGDPAGPLMDKPLSDTSSDSGCNIEQQLLSPEPQPGLDLVDYISNHDTDEEDAPLHAVVNPRTNSPDIMTTTTTYPVTSIFKTGATTIILPVITPKTVKVTVKTCAAKKRRVSSSSHDSGMDEASSSASQSPRQSVSSKKGKYPALDLNEEEKRICEREAIKLPTHYPLSREEERNLKRIRRKIRNKVSAQDSRKRKKEYMDNMEDRVRACSDENDELHKKIEQLETQNKTLAGQLRRLHQIIVNGGFTSRQKQTSTAMMVLLLSTALFLIPGMRDSAGGGGPEPRKSELDITQAIKMPPMPGQSRSLLHFAPTIKEEFDMAEDHVATNQKNAALSHDGSIVVVKEETIYNDSPFHDHDYFITARNNVAVAPPAAKKRKRMTTTMTTSYIEADVPPQGYGFDTTDNNGGYKDIKIENPTQDRRLNVNVTTGSQGMRTVVLHVPKDIK